MARHRTMVFLGAGASVPFGFASTPQLLPCILQERGLDGKALWGGINGASREKRDRMRLRSFLNGLLPGWKSADASDLPLITDVLSLVDYSLAEGKPLFPGQSMADLAEIRHLIERGIYEVLWTPDDKVRKNRALLDRFAGWIQKTTKSGGVVSTNYDTCVEQRLFARMGARVHARMDFGFPWLDTQTAERTVRSRPQDPDLVWFKLHGSLNWLRCPVCEHLYLNPYGKIAHQPFRAETDELNTCHCGEAARLQLHLVAPSMHRSVRDANLLAVWRNALNLLIQCDHWIMIGYSLPGEDLAIRSMLIRAYHARTQPPKITVVQFGTAAQSRYRILFPKHIYYEGGLGAWLDAGAP